MDYCCVCGKNYVPEGQDVCSTCWKELIGDGY